MDFRREAIDKLRCYTAKRESLARSEREIRRLEMEFIRTKSASSGCAPVHGGTSRQEDAMINNISLRTELENAMKLTREWLDIVDGALASLDDEDRRVLELMCIRKARGNLDRLCAELHIEHSTAYRRRDAALRRFTMSLYGVVEI